MPACAEVGWSSECGVGFSRPNILVVLVLATLYKIEVHHYIYIHTRGTKTLHNIHTHIIKKRTQQNRHHNHIYKYSIICMLHINIYDYITRYILSIMRLRVRISVCAAGLHTLGFCSFLKIKYIGLSSYQSIYKQKPNRNHIISVHTECVTKALTLVFTFPTNLYALITHPHTHTLSNTL